VLQTFTLSGLWVAGSVAGMVLTSDPEETKRSVAGTVLLETKSTVLGEWGFEPRMLMK
jgi:hypothetical protein